MTCLLISLNANLDIFILHKTKLLLSTLQVKKLDIVLDIHVVNDFLPFDYHEKFSILLTHRLVFPLHLC